MAIGTETDGSIVSPSSIMGVVGLKPTVGRISRDGIIPISHTQDTPGPIARTVSDAALLLAALAGPDPRDPATLGAPAPGDYLAALDKDALRGARIGVAREYFTGHDEVDQRSSTPLAQTGAAGRRAGRSDRSAEGRATTPKSRRCCCTSSSTICRCGSRRSRRTRRSARSPM